MNGHISRTSFSGQPFAEYKVTSSRFIFPIVLLLFASFLAYSIYKGEGNTILNLLCGVVAIALGVYGIKKALNERGARVSLYPEGLIYIRDDTSEIVPWDDIESVYHEITVNSAGKTTTREDAFTIAYNRSRTLTFDNAHINHIELGERIQQEVTKRLLPIALEAFERGEEVSFAKIKVKKEGISNGKETVPWNEVDGIQIYETVSIFSKGKRHGWAPSGEIPNYLVLQNLVDKARNTSREQARTITTDLKSPTAQELPGSNFQQSSVLFPKPQEPPLVSPKSDSAQIAQEESLQRARAALSQMMSVGQDEVNRYLENATSTGDKDHVLKLLKDLQWDKKEMPLGNKGDWGSIGLWGSVWYGAFDPLKNSSIYFHLARTKAMQDGISYNVISYLKVTRLPDDIYTCKIDEDEKED